MTSHEKFFPSHLHSAIDLMEAAVNAGITDPADLAAKLQLGQAVARFLGAPPAAVSGLALPSFEKVIEGGQHIITRDRVHGIEWDIGEFNGKRMTDEQAVAAVKELRTGGYSDWRLPTRRELLTLVDDAKSSPAIDKEFFPNCRSDWYRTGTVYAPYPGCRWGVDFGYGSSGFLLDVDVYFVRAVRASQ